jgi:hypothetical protein
LRRLGVAQLADGLAALPADARTREQLEWAAEDVVEAGGVGGVWLARPAARAQERDLASSMNAARAVEYDAIILAAREACADSAAERSRVLRRLRAEMRRVERRDYFRTSQREHARHALLELAEIASAPAETAEADRR